MGSCADGTLTVHGEGFVAQARAARARACARPAPLQPRPSRTTGPRRAHSAGTAGGHEGAGRGRA
eukprot:2725807-Prymnesium_polylepis.1